MTDGDSKKKSPPKYGIGSGKRDGLYPDTKNPGPGTYLVPDKTFKDGPKYHMGLKVSSSMASLGARDGPGPCAYTVNKNLFSSVGFKMGNEKLGSLSAREGPGPGAYSHKTLFQRISGSAIFGRDGMAGANKTARSNLLSAPGPG